MVMLAFASISIIFALIDRQAPTGRLVRVLIGVWSGALVVAAIFPPTPVGTPAVWYDTLHRYAALVGFVCLPLAGIRLARRFRTHARWRRTANAVAACSAASLLSAAPGSTRETTVKARPARSAVPSQTRPEPADR